MYFISLPSQFVCMNFSFIIRDPIHQNHVKIQRTHKCFDYNLSYGSDHKIAESFQVVSFRHIIGFTLCNSNLCQTPKIHSRRHLERSEPKR